jgi:iron-sulfur cluster repair protein YtfE (RIC family)
MANAPSLVTVLHAAASAQHVMATDSLEMDKANAPLASLTTVAHATMHHVHRATLTRLAPHAVTMTTSSPAPTRTWAPKAV